MKVNFITIEREYGSGGTQIARRLSKVCGVPCYGQEILEAVAEKLNISVENINRYEERTSSSLLYTISLLGQVSSGQEASLSPEDRIFLEEQAEIRHMAENGPAIFLGHCASEALKNRAGVVRVFIHADDAHKRERILREYRIEESKIETTRKRFDKKRANYYFANTAKRWADLRNYDLVLNSSSLGIQGCVTALAGMLNRQS